MKQPIHFYDCEKALLDKLNEMEGELIARLSAEPFLLQFVLDQITYLDISRHLAIDRGEVESTEKAQGIKECIYSLKRLIQLAYPRKTSEEETDR